MKASLPKSSKFSRSTAKKQPAITPWEPARLFVAGLLGLFGVWLFSYFLDDYERGKFGDFLLGQVGFEGMWTSPVFWKLATGFLAGAVAGYFIFLEIPLARLQKANRLALALALFIIPVIIYIPAMSAGFIWDDDQEISANPSLRHTPPPPGQAAPFKTNWYGLWEIWTGGITSDKVEDAARAELGKGPAPVLVKVLRAPLRWVEYKIWGFPGYRFRGNESADYFPLKTTMLWIEYQIWGSPRNEMGQPIPDPHPFHVMNILVHALDGLLLWMVLRQLKVPGAWLGSLLFAIHPVHAESVAWIAERKNTLSLCFILLSLSYWLRFEETEKRSRYAWALLFFMASLLCKTHVVVYPAVLLLIAWWKTGTLTLRDVRRTAPFFIVGLLLALVTIWFQNDRAIGGEEIPIGDLASRIAGAGVVTWSYLIKAILPMDLNTIYANTSWLWWPLTEPQLWMFMAAGMVPMTLLMLFVLREFFPTPNTVASRTPFFVFAYFVGTLFPVLGLFKMSYMRLTLQADHFQYFSDIAIVAVAGALIARLYEKAHYSWRPALVGACLILVFCFSAYSWERAGVHLSEKTLWTACLKKNEASWQAHNHIGAVLYGEQKFEEAAPHFARAVELKPKNPEVHNNLGLVLWRYGHREEALAEYRKAVEIKGEVLALRSNLAGALMEMKRFDEAIEQYHYMLNEAPNDPNLHAGMGFAFSQKNQFKEAKQEFEMALKLDPNNPSIRQNYEYLKRLVP